jgi:hypothetical protein
MSATACPFLFPISFPPPRHSSDSAASRKRDYRCGGYFEILRGRQQQEGSGGKAQALMSRGETRVIGQWDGHAGVVWFGLEVGVAQPLWEEIAGQWRA